MRKICNILKCSKIRKLLLKNHERIFDCVIVSLTEHEGMTSKSLFYNVYYLRQIKCSTTYIHDKVQYFNMR